MAPESTRFSGCWSSARCPALNRRKGQRHERIRTAAERQIEFYRDFKEARVRNARNLPNLLDHPDLRESDYDLHRVWDLIGQTYPVLDPRLAEEIESHLCNLDIV